MAKKKTSGKSVKTTKKTEVSKTNVFQNFRFGESYTSLVLGIIAVIIATVLLLSFVNTRQSNKPDGNVVPTVVDIKDLNIPAGQLNPEAKAGGSYTVVAGDTLWSIAEKAYKSGYNWVDIAKANKLTDADDIHAGNRLVLPAVTAVTVKPTTAAKQAVEAKPAISAKPAAEGKGPARPAGGTVITGEDEAAVSRTERIVSPTYKIAEGDTLWSIAVRTYADGYKWTEIAKANNLSNPDLIHVGNTLKLPQGK